MANTILAPTTIAREALFHLENHLVMGQNVYRAYEESFAKVGDTVNIRRPVQFEPVDGAVLDVQDVTENNTSITISKRKHVAWKFDMQSLTLTIEEYAKRYIEPAIIALANIVDVDLLALYSDFYTTAGTPGTTPNSFSNLGDLAAAMDRVPVPDDGNRKLILDPAARWSMNDALKGLFDNSMPRDFVRKGKLGTIANFEIYGDQNVARHTTGAFTTSSTPLVDGASQTGAALLTNGWSSGAATLTKGDVFTLAGVNGVNRVSKVDTGELQEFVVTADISDTAGVITIAIDPPITTSGAFQTVTASPANDAVITMKGTESTAYAQNLGFHRNALALVTVPLELPDGASWKARVQNNGLSIRLVKDYDIVNDHEIIRLDILYGVKTIYPELGARLWGK